MILILTGFFVCVSAEETGGESKIYRVSSDGEFSIEFNVDPGDKYIYSFQYDLT